MTDAATLTAYDRDHGELLLGGNALALDGDRLRHQNSVRPLRLQRFCSTLNLIRFRNLVL